MTLEGFSNLAFIFTNPRNFRVDQLSATIWFSSFCLDADWYKRVSCSRRGSINGCGLPSVEAILTSNGVRKPATWAWQAVLTDSVVPSGNMTVSSSRIWHRTAGSLSHSEARPPRSSWGLLDPTSSELMVGPCNGNQHCKGQKWLPEYVFHPIPWCNMPSPNQMKKWKPLNPYMTVTCLMPCIARGGCAPPSPQGKPWKNHYRGRKWIYINIMRYNKLG